MTERSGEFVQSLERGLAVIRAFDGEHPELTLSDVARATGLTRAAARRFLLTLVELGYVRTDGKLFALRPRVLELGYAYLSGLGLSEVALPHMEELVARVHESSSLSVLDGGDIAYVPVPVDAGEVHVLLVGAAHEVGESQRAVIDVDATAQAHRADESDLGAGGAGDALRSRHA